MLTKNSIEEPKLAPPGAGIPLPQKLLLRFFVRPFVAARTPWEVSEKNFNRINEKILKELEGLTDEQLATRILVPPQKGLEDSSRYWSITMVLEHLVIVSVPMMELIPALSKGYTPPGEADTARVKPHLNVDHHQTLPLFKKMISDGFKKLNAEIRHPAHSTARFLHPWFGGMNAQEWYWLLAMHHGLHLKQIREIKKRLPLL